MSSETIRVRGASEHNLRGVDLVLPRESLTVFTGVSGSGKSSLAFDTIFQEGQRRFLQSLSSYARQFLGSMEKPQVEQIEGLSPAVSIDQKRRGRNPRSTVGTVTEVHDHLRLLFARLGTPHCPTCGEAIEARSPAEIVDRLLIEGEGQRLQVLAPVIRDRKGEYRKELEGWQADGYVRARIDGTVVRLEQAPELDRYVRHTIELVLDRLVLAREQRHRLLEAVERAVGLTDGLVSFLREVEPPGGADRPANARQSPGDDGYQLVATAKACPSCGFSLPELEPRLFSFNSPHGACPACDGVGELHRPSPARVVPDPTLPLNAGALACLTAEGRVPFGSLDLDEVAALVRAAGHSPATPWQELPDALRRLILQGSGGQAVALTYLVAQVGRRELTLQRPFAGVLPALAQAWGWTRASFLERWMDVDVCPSCNGTRLKPEARAVKLWGEDLGALGRRTVTALAEWVERQQPPAGLQAQVGGPLLREIGARLGFLLELGLGYLTLDRGAATLSGGEYQRIRLARQLGSRLQGVLYVLDEPSIGLHPRDNRRLIHTLTQLRDGGNTVLVVEHDEETMLAADQLVELGPGAGELGGRLVAQGTPAQVAQADTHTGRYLSGRETIPLPAARRAPGAEQLVVRNARQHNLKGIDVAIPLGCLVSVTGVSGSGKSTLVDLTLRRALARRFYRAGAEPGLHDALEGLDALDKVIEIDQSPIGRTPRSNPATYVKVFDLIRDLFAELPESRARGYKKGRFSFNVKGGRCEECEGAGIKEIELQLLAPVSVPCEACEGKRFNPETLQIRYRDKTITDVLELTVHEAAAFFTHHPAISRILTALLDVGLGYLRLGQPSTTLSGGEAQRVKLASELRRPATGRTLYILDEPTTGLHAHDVMLLLTALQRLVDGGNTVLVVEHNLEVVKVSDWVIDLGPEGGGAGGEVVVAGTPEQVAACARSHTGLALRPLLGERAASAAPAAAHGTALPGNGDKRRNGKSRGLTLGLGLWRPRRLDEVRGAAEAETPAYQASAALSAGRSLIAGQMRPIAVHGARQHNLKDIDLTLPGGSLTVVTGVSGSGKSSLAYHTLFAEGQRRYVESLSTYARRFLGRQADADVDRIDGLAPAIAIDQKNSQRNPRSTVATVTEIHDHLRLLYARIGRPHCPTCDAPLEAISPSLGARRVLQACAGQTVLLLAAADDGVKLGQALTKLLADGQLRVRLADGALLRLDQKLTRLQEKASGWSVVLDRVTVQPEALTRLSEAIEAGYRLGRARVTVQPLDDGARPLVLTEQAACPEHGLLLSEPLSPRHFSFNHHKGACPACAGLGVVPRGGVLPTRPTSAGPGGWGRRRPAAAEQEPAEDWELWMIGPGAGGEPCPTCHGERLAPLSRAVRVDGLRLPELTALSVTDARQRLDGLRLNGEESAIARELRQELDARLGFLDAVGIGYLTLDRRAASLSGGEAQRIRLASQLGAHLSGCLYVLDEPTIGLHPRDTALLLATLRRLRDQGNTLVVVEHDLETIRIADHLIDIGPGAGELGGQVVAQGTPAEVAETQGSLTGDFLAGRRRIELPGRRETGTPGVRVVGARAHNLKGIDASFPIGAITCVTGVSGCGKSSLVVEVLQKGVAQALHQGEAIPGAHDRLEGLDTVERLVVVDQAPIGRTPRSNPASYTGLLDLLRELFARLPESQARGYGAGRFSYNRAGGRCAACEGMGSVQVEMHFLSDIWVVCDSCHGNRFDEATLQIRYRGLNIAEVLRLTVDEAVAFFAHHRRIGKICEMLAEVGLGYLRLGQAATTLSGGEAQRLKLATELGRRGGAGTLYLLDEPTTGLHLADVQKLLTLLRKLADRQAAVVVIEHNLEVIKIADQVIDLGPEAGDAGGYLVVAGTPEEVAAHPTSHTGRYLRPLLAAGASQAAQGASGKPAPRGRRIAAPPGQRAARSARAPRSTGRV